MQISFIISPDILNDMRKILIAIIIIVNSTANAQNRDTNYYAPPVQIPMFLTGNFGELRSNHFHSGIDIKTEGRTGLPVYAVADGYVSRIYVSPFGFGHALYIDHPNGTTTVYGHLEAFSEKIREYVRDIQYRKESFYVDLSVPPGKFPVKKGEQIALSGNTGSSGGPHLHFEIRDTKTQHPLNPLKYRFDIKDDIKPKILSVIIYPVSEDAGVAGRHSKKRCETVFYDRAYHIRKNLTIPVYGTIGFGLQAIDYLDGNWSKCGIYSLVLKVDNKVIYSFSMDEFSFNESRYINSHVDYEQKIRLGRNIYKTWIEPGNKLSIYNREKGNGLYTFTDGKTHQITYDITDVYGNMSTLNFNVISRNQNIQVAEEKGILFEYDGDNEFKEEGIEINFPEGTFYSNFYFQYERKPSFAGIYSEVHGIHNRYTPVQKFFTVKIKPDTLPEDLTDKALLAYVNPRNNKQAAIGGEYKNGWVEAKIRGFGDVAVAIDTIAPSVVSLSLKNGSLTESTQIRFRIKDNFSGIDTFRGTIDGKWVLFEYDVKNSLLVYKFDKKRFDFGKQHELRLVVKDVKGNQKVYEAKFYK